MLAQPAEAKLDNICVFYEIDVDTYPDIVLFSAKVIMVWVSPHGVSGGTSYPRVGAPPVQKYPLASFCRATLDNCQITRGKNSPTRRGFHLFRRFFNSFRIGGQVDKS